MEAHRFHIKRSRCCSRVGTHTPPIRFDFCNARRDFGELPVLQQKQTKKTKAEISTTDPSSHEASAAAKAIADGTTRQVDTDKHGFFLLPISTSSVILGPMAGRKGISVGQWRKRIHRFRGLLKT